MNRAALVSTLLIAIGMLCTAEEDPRNAAVRRSIEAKTTFEPWVIFVDKHGDKVGQWRAGYFIFEREGVLTSDQLIEFQNTCDHPLDLVFYWYDQHQVERDKVRRNVDTNDTILTGHFVSYTQEDIDKLKASDPMASTHDAIYRNIALCKWKVATQ